MLFRELYNIANSVAKPYVRFELLRESINAHHQRVGRVDVRRIVYQRPTSSAYYHLADTDRDSPYEEEYTVAEIVYCSSLDADNRERRYALTKELMHAFDSQEQEASSREKFIRLMRDVQNRPLPIHASPMYQSEFDTRWMAALILCPRSLRDPYAAQGNKNAPGVAEFAEAFAIPEWVASSVLDEYYDVAYQTLIEGDEA